jgi:hypothetical protein
VGGFSLPRALGGPVIGGAALAAFVLLTNLPFVTSAVLGTLIYVAVLFTFERVLFSDDLDLITGILRSGRGPKQPAGGTA